MIQKRTGGKKCPPSCQLGLNRWSWKQLLPSQIQILSVIRNTAHFFSSVILLENISFYALSRPKLNFGRSINFKFIFWASKSENFAFYLMQIARLKNTRSTQFHIFVIVLLLNGKITIGKRYKLLPLVLTNF